MEKGNSCEGGKGCNLLDYFLPIWQWKGGVLCDGRSVASFRSPPAKATRITAPGKLSSTIKALAGGYHRVMILMRYFSYCRDLTY